AIERDQMLARVGQRQRFGRRGGWLRRWGGGFRWRGRDLGGFGRGWLRRCNFFGRRQQRGDLFQRRQRRDDGRQQPADGFNGDHVAIETGGFVPAFRLDQRGMGVAQRLNGRNKVWISRRCRIGVFERRRFVEKCRAVQLAAHQHLLELALQRVQVVAKQLPECLHIGYQSLAVGCVGAGGGFRSRAAHNEARRFNAAGQWPQSGQQQVQGDERDQQHERSEE